MGGEERETSPPERQTSGQRQTTRLSDGETEGQGTGKGQLINRHDYQYQCIDNEVLNNITENRIKIGAMSAELERFKRTSSVPNIARILPSDVGAQYRNASCAIFDLELGGALME